MKENPYEPPRMRVRVRRKSQRLARAGCFSLAAGAIPTAVAALAWLAYRPLIGTWDRWEFPLGLITFASANLAAVVWGAIGVGWLVYLLTHR